MNSFEQMKFNPTPDRAKVAETIKRAGFESQEAQILHEQYFSSLRNRAEKNPEGGKANVVTYIEMAKLYYDAGMIETAINSLVENETGIAYEARNMGFDDLYNQIWDLVDEWEEKGTKQEGNHNPDNTSAEKLPYDFTKGCTLEANQDMAFLGISKGDIINLVSDGKYIAVGSLSWDNEQLNKEVQEGIWKVKNVG